MVPVQSDNPVPNQVDILSQEAVIVELWIEDWHGRDLPYAECLTDEGTGSRVWFHRDKPGTPMGVTGRILPDALF